MDRDPGEFLGGKAVADLSDDEFDAYMARFPPAPGIPHVDDGGDDEADADIAAGRIYEHEVVARWLRTAGRPDWKSFEAWFADLNG